VSSEDHDRQTDAARRPSQGRGARSVGQWLAAKEGDALDSLQPSRHRYLLDQLGELRWMAARQRQHFGIAAPWATQRATLKPQGETLAGAFRLGTGNNLRHREYDVRSWR